MTVPKFLYTAWFRDLSMPQDEQDHEWPACFLVEAQVSLAARSRGDELVKRYVARQSNVAFLRATVEDARSAEGDLSTLPILRIGEELSDRDVGW